MTKLEALEKIRKLPIIKDEYIYYVYYDGQVAIFDKEGIFKTILYYDFFRFINNGSHYDMEKYINYLAKPIYENDEIVGYE